jgi:hypothetical protein
MRSSLKVCVITVACFSGTDASLSLPCERRQQGAGTTPSPPERKLNVSPPPLASMHYACAVAEATVISGRVVSICRSASTVIPA